MSQIDVDALRPADLLQVGAADVAVGLQATDHVVIHVLRGQVHADARPEIVVRHQRFRNLEHRAGQALRIEQDAGPAVAVRRDAVAHRVAAVERTQDNLFKGGEAGHYANPLVAISHHIPEQGLHRTGLAAADQDEAVALVVTSRHLLCGKGDVGSGVEGQGQARGAVAAGRGGIDSRVDMAAHRGGNRDQAIPAIAVERAI